MKVFHAAIMFLMFIALILGIYSQSYGQFNLNGANISYSTTNEVIIQGGQTTEIGNSSTNSTSTSTTNNQGCSGNGCSCASIIPGLCAVQLAIVSGVAFIECQLGNTADCAPNSGQVAQNVANFLAPTSPGIPGIPPLIATNQFASTNAWYKLFANPLDSALSIMAIFLGLGILAGLLGAGILARVMASVGIGLATIDYVEGNLSTFQQLPTLIYFGFNGIMAVLLLIIAWEAFNAPGGE